MAVDFAPPRYAQMVAALQQRIESGQYPPGTLLPSENQLIAEFGVSRTTVTRALQLLSPQTGRLDRPPARPRNLRPRPARGSRTGPPWSRGGRPARHWPGNQAAGRRTARAPARVAAALGVAEGTPAVYRRRLTVEDDGAPAELVTSWFSAEIAAGTLLDSPQPILEGIREHLRARKRARIDHVTERITARLPTAEEARALDMPRRTPVLGVLVTAHDSAGAVLQVADAVLPGDRHELEDTYPVS